MPGVVGAWSGATSPRTGAARCRWSGRSPRTSRRRTTGPSRRTRRGSRATASPWSSPSRAGWRTTRPSRPGGVRTAGAGPRHRGGSEGRLPDRARRVGDQRRGPLEPRRRRRPGRVRQRARAAAAPVRGAQDHAQPDRTAWRARVGGAAMGEFTLWTSTQIPHIARFTLSGTTGIPEHKLRIVAPDVRVGRSAQAQRLRGGGALRVHAGPGERSSGSRTGRRATPSRRRAAG